MGKIKITNHQVFALTACFTSGTGLLVISADMTGLAKQDAWLSVLFGLLFAMFEVWMICFFWSRYPGMTYVEIMKKIFGKWIGWLASAGFVIMCLNTAPMISWYMGNFVTTQVMPETPVYAITFIYIVTIAISILYGLETIARAYEIFNYIVSFLFILAMVLVLPNARIENLLPVFEEGLIPILKGSLLLATNMIFPVIMLLMIYPSCADNTYKARKSFLTGYLWGGFLLLISNIMSILILGSSITANSQYPVYLLTKEINVADIFTRLEFLVAAAWIITLIMRGLVYFYAGTLAFSQLLGLKSHRRIVLPMGLIVVVMSQVSYPNVIYQADWDTYVWPPFITTFGLVLPVILVIVFLIKKHIFKKDVGSQ